MGWGLPCSVVQRTPDGVGTAVEDMGVNLWVVVTSLRRAQGMLCGQAAPARCGCHSRLPGGGWRSSVGCFVANL